LILSDHCPGKDFSRCLLKRSHRLRKIDPSASLRADTSPALEMREGVNASLQYSIPPVPICKAC
jgi:hypothetical protein